MNTEDREILDSLAAVALGPIIAHALAMDRKERAEGVRLGQMTGAEAWQLMGADDISYDAEKCAFAAYRFAEKMMTVRNLLRDGDDATGPVEIIQGVHVVAAKLPPATIDHLTAVAKWLDRIVDRMPELPASFLDNTDPTPLAKKFRETIKSLTP